ncbi:hypothetical protein F8C13_29005, partial [Escherichia coli]|nr:hypothetical protein [Escherichia coli]
SLSLFPLSPPAPLSLHSYALLPPPLTSSPLSFSFPPFSPPSLSPPPSPSLPSPPPPPSLSLSFPAFGRSAFRQSFIALSFFPSLASPAPLFFLAVPGLVPTERVPPPRPAPAGCHLFLPPPLGIGVLTPAATPSLLHPDHQGFSPSVLCRL